MIAGLIFTLFLTTCGVLDAHIRMGIITSSSYCGERELARRLKIAAENLGWTAVVDENEGRDLLLQEGLDLVICMLPRNENFISYCPNYLTIFHSHDYFDYRRSLLPFYHKYDGYLITIHDRETIAESLANDGKQFHFMPFYPTLQYVPYFRAAPNAIITSTPVWGNRLNDEKYRMLYKRLSQTGIVKFYGINKVQDVIDDGYIGQVPFDGVSLIPVLQQYGIVLILHSEGHNRDKIPSSRIFEAAAASCVIISDENDFVKEHFGNSVFYIDTTATVENIVRQIEEWYQVIMLDPEWALDMAQRAHEIFIEKFEMSHQLLELEALHQTVKNGFICETP